MSKKITALEIKRDIAKKAMPDVKKIVEKHGTTAVQYCLNQVKDYDKKIRQLNQLRRDAKTLEKEITK